MKTWKLVEDKKDKQYEESKGTQVKHIKDTSQHEVGRASTSRARGNGTYQEPIKNQVWSTNGFETMRIWEDPAGDPMNMK